MKVAQLLERRKVRWAELEAMCRELEGGRARRLGATGVLRFAGAYRSACADLALADAYQLPPHTVQYLHDLVGRAHNQLYRSRRFQWRSWADVMFRRVPTMILFDRAAWLSCAMFWGIFFASMALAYWSRAFSVEVIGEATMDSFEEMYAEPIDGRSFATSSAMGGFYVFNNASIGLQCFTAGLLLGVGGIFVTVSNALQLGAVFGFIFTTPSRGNFIEFVTAHGPFELTAIVLSAGAGMRLGFAIVDTGGLSRLASLRKAVDRTMPTAAAAVVLFCLAAVIEGFVSPSGAPYAVKLGVALVSSAILLFYVVVLGLRGRMIDES
jgi:uncharacterized membrane protein SpoIIM required for sporulation